MKILLPSMIYLIQGSMVSFYLVGNLQVVTWDSISMISEAISSEAVLFYLSLKKNFAQKIS